MLPHRQQVCAWSMQMNSIPGVEGCDARNDAHCCQSREHNRAKPITMHEPENTSPDTVMYLSLCGRATKIEGYFNLFQVLDLSVGGFVALNIFLHGTHKALGMHGRENDP